ncbi:DegQ family serine endoprotease [Salinicola endophyticus]|uniref:Probable periplasmic serine endoprotease DegP-like n=1 Tax=Salinicola endophyticus TaxID=1949083 RepID=A0ABY8FJS8_9GAMM|nr:DegQ family serine endoprotease [Salinicola endophyticus]WFF43068.1 DegQ family serine endoprotease [Salinicola endophyticus]
MERMTRWFAPWLVLMMALLSAQAARASDLPDFTALVKQAAPGVVNISTTSTVSASDDPFGQQDVPDIFRRFFGDQMPPMPGAPSGEEERKSLGSGFIIRSDGYILTNAHVVKNADKIMVRLNDRRELPAKLVGSDPRTDVALLKVDAKDLPTLKIGNSDDLQVGEWVAAIGSPFGFDHSVTAGIVSAINRTLPSDTYVPFIQTDVAINPGNSGGPLFNLDGQVVGINSQIYTRSGGFMGLSFAIPISVAMNVADQLRTEGHVSRGWLGVVIQPVSKDLAESFGLDDTKGALVSDVSDDSPAKKAGLKAGDVILSVNGDAVDDSTTLPRIIGKFAPGAEIKLKVLRDGDTRNIDVTVGDWPASLSADGSSGGQSTNDQTKLGIAISDLSAQEKQQLDVDSGVLVRRVDPRGAAAAAGIQPGDVIVSFDQKPVDSADALIKAVKKVDGDRAVPVRISRDGNSLFVALRLKAHDKKE